MDDILKMLYRGRIHPQERGVPSSPELAQAARRVRLLESRLLETMDGAQREAMEELAEAYNEVSAAQIEEAYLSGMRMGAKLAAALLGDKKDLPNLT